MHDKHAVLRRKASCCSGAVVRVHDQLWAGTPARRARVFDVRRRSRVYPSDYSTCTGPRGPRDHHVALCRISAPTGAGRRRDEPALHQDRGSRPGCRAGGTAWVCASRDRDRGRACGYLWGALGSRIPYLFGVGVGLKPLPCHRRRAPRAPLAGASRTGQKSTVARSAQAERCPQHPPGRCAPLTASTARATRTLETRSTTR